MVEITEAQLQGWTATYFWPFVRIAAFFTVAPIFGARFVPARIRIVLAAAVTLLAAPLLPSPPLVALLSADGVVITVQQVLIGVALGFIVQLVFDAVGLGGQLLANSMGLSFAFNVDPMRGASTAAVGQLYLLLITLTFVALNGHLAFLEAVVEGFRSLPVGSSGFGTSAAWTVLGFASQLFAGAVAVALPGMTALLVVNLAFGVMSRAAPSLNLFAVGFPITLVFGLVVIFVGLPVVQQNFHDLVARALEAVRETQAAGPR
ncbi:MAG: flagellar biosynthetic protein FliR [Steroidobacteraceae bacterium]|jgi:flagellar biosynthetic protein FliR|nr:flagellar biosynthetic protein FliR [Steroidobacteraceae bacterium]